MGDYLPTNEPKSADKATRRRASAAVDEWATNAPAALRGWLAANGIAEFSVGQADRKEIQRRLVKRGHWEPSRTWFSQSKWELTSAFGVRRQGAFTELLWRVVEARMNKSAVALAKFRIVRDDNPPKHLSEDEAWVYGHPGLCAGIVDETSDPIILAIVAEYERDHPPPRQGAVTLYLHCLADDKYRNEFLKSCRDRARDAAKGGEAEPKDAEETAILDLEAELAAMGEDEEDE